MKQSVSGQHKKATHSLSFFLPPPNRPPPRMANRLDLVAEVMPKAPLVERVAYDEATANEIRVSKRNIMIEALLIQRQRLMWIQMISTKQWITTTSTMKWWRSHTLTGFCTTWKKESGLTGSTFSRTTNGAQTMAIMKCVEGAHSYNGVITDGRKETIAVNSKI